ncbi:MAG: phosphate-starvation-inducible PsiE family protein [Proteobacteria bacterium]|nr:phosphate-starvation-inducible PsiE family protein [Pseudomonadota bacterium]
MKYFKKIINILVELLIPFVILSLMIGVAKLFLDLKDVFSTPKISKGFELLIENLLSIFIVIELLKSIVEYFEVNRLKITFIIDASIVFVMREVMVGLYKHNMDYMVLFGLSSILLVMGILRTLAILYSPDYKKEVHHE